MMAKKWFVVSLVAVLPVLQIIRKRRRVRQKLCTSSLSGREHVQELLTGSPTVVFELFRMDTDDFVQLCIHFRERGWLEDNKHVYVEEKMAIFLATVGHDCRNRLVKYRFQHSGETISKYFHEVLWAMLHFSKEMIVDPPFDGSLGRSRAYRRLRQGPFKGAVGALDGALINAKVPIDKQIPFRARGGKQCFQNVMAVCDFDMKFTYVMAGWERIANDARILNETLRDQDKNGFPIPPADMYYLCDAAYTHTRGFMCPYRNVRYWMSEYKKAPPRNKEEKFNRAHAQLRNVIEKTFGVLKARFPILTRMPSYSFQTQVHIVVACMTIHNYIRTFSVNDDLFRRNEYGEENENNEDNVVESAIHADQVEAPPRSSEIFSSNSQRHMTELRNNIAEQLWSGNY